MDLWGKRGWSIGLLVAIMLVMGAGTAGAHPNTKGPHNENLNTTLDIYRADHFSGAFNAAITNITEVGDIGAAPRPRVVSSSTEADVIVRYNTGTETGAGFIHWEGTRPDVIRISRTSSYPIWVLTHELMHGYGMRDLTMAECAAIVPDPETGRKSVMCHSRWESGDLTAHDVADLRLIPNQRVTTTARLAHEPYAPERFSVARHKTH